MGETTAKTCSKCKVVKFIDDFYLHKAYKDGHQSRCKECMKATSRAQMKRYRERRKNLAELQDSIEARLAKHEKLLQWAAEGHDELVKQVKELETQVNQLLLS